MTEPARIIRQRPLMLFGEARPVARIGAEQDEAAMPEPVKPVRNTLFAPRGLCLFEPEGPLWVSDTGHHRVLGWSQPLSDQQHASWIIGQADFESERPGRGGSADGASLRVPTGICRYGDGLAIADAWNHRVQIWDWQL